MEREEERQPTEDREAKNSEQIRKREIEQQTQQQIQSLDWVLPTRTKRHLFNHRAYVTKISLNPFDFDFHKIP